MNTMLNKKQFLLYAIQLAFPIMIQNLISTLVNSADTVMLGYVSQTAMAASSLANQYTFVLFCFYYGLAIGTSVLCAQYWGKGDHQTVERILGLATKIVLLISLLFFVISFFFPEYIMHLFTNSPETIAEGVTYLRVLSFSFVFMGFAQIFVSALRSVGKVVFPSVIYVVSLLVNVFLNATFIFGLFGAPKLGIVGAAVATVAGQIVAAVMAVIFNIKVNKEIHITFKGFRPSGKRICNILFIGIPSVIMMAIGSVMTFCMNKILVVFTSTAVAVFGVYFKLQSFAFMPIFGMNSGMVPIIAFNYGAKREDRVIQTLKLAVMYAEIIMILFMIAVQIFPVPMLSIFSASSDMIRMGVPALRTISISFIFAGICIICSSFFQALGSSIYSMLVSFVRQIIFLVPCAYIFSKTGNVNLVWWAWPIAELASVALSVFFFIRVRKKKFAFMEQ